MSRLLDDVLALEGALSAESAEFGPERPPEKLALLFRLLLARLLRQGDGTGALIRRLLELAEASAAKGMVPAALPGEVRATLVEAARSVRGSGAWATEAELWWEPLPEPGVMERRWEKVTAGALRLPKGGGEGVASREGAVEGVLLELVYGELEGEPGELGLAAEGVGAEGRRSRHRSD